MLKELTVNQIGGLFNQLYNLDEKLIDTDIENDFLNINSIFWSKILNLNHLKNMVYELQNRNSIYSTKINAVKSNPEIFYETFNEAINNINSQTLDAQTEFSYLETLQIICHMHTYLYTSPFELTIYEGFKHNQFSSKELKNNCLLKYSNPYYEFIKDTIIPKINCKELDVLWIKGRPNISGFCLASLIKQINPNILVVSIANNSEFFSFSKITSLLKDNHPLFSVFDCIVLNDSNDTYNQLREHLDSDKNIYDVDNIIYTPDKGNKIIPTKRSSQNSNSFCIDNNKSIINHVINLKLFPNNQCYWNKCSFCAINKKYTCENNNWNLDSTLLKLKKMFEIGVDKFWVLDEAIPIDTLSDICNYISENNLNFHWHARTRIEKEILNNNLPQRLYDSGLKHILFGFESASSRILKLMNKTNLIDNYLELSEEIVKTFNNVNIHVHFPVLIGFPTESQSERDKTLKFVNYLQKKYPYFSYNINILNLDVASIMYKHWSNYNISSLKYPCEPRYFIGNGVSWQCDNNSISIKELELQAIKSMKSQFSWYPNDSLVDIISFYSMWEYSRSQLSCSLNEENSFDCINDLPLENALCFTPKSTIFKDSDDLYCLYNFKNHQCIRGGKLIYDIYQHIREDLSIKECLNKYDNSFHHSIYQFITDLIKFGFLETIIN